MTIKHLLLSMLCALPLGMLAQTDAQADAPQAIAEQQSLIATSQPQAQAATASKTAKAGKLDLAVTVGTLGVGVDLAAHLNSVLQVRAGFSFTPHVSTTIDFGVEGGKVGDDGQWVSTKFDKLTEMLEGFTGYTIDQRIDMECKPTFQNFSLLLNVFPFRNKHWHFTAGAYFGPSTIATACNTMEEMTSLFAMSLYNNMYTKIENDEPIYGEDYYLDPTYEQKILGYGRLGVYVGNKADGTPYLMEPDDNSMVKAKIKVNNFRPYVGFGYGGRLIKGDDRYTVSFDCGAMFWGGTPKIVTHDGTDLAADVTNIGGKVGDYVSVISSFKVYPVLNLRIARRLF